MCNLKSIMFRVEVVLEAIKYHGFGLPTQRGYDSWALTW